MNEEKEWEYLDNDNTLLLENNSSINYFGYIYAFNVDRRFWKKNRKYFYCKCSLIWLFISLIMFFSFCLIFFLFNIFQTVNKNYLKDNKELIDPLLQTHLLNNNTLNKNRLTFKWPSEAKFMNCYKIFKNDVDYLKNNKNQIHQTYIEEEDTRELDMRCKAIRKRNYFAKFPMSLEEAAFPLAFAKIVYKVNFFKLLKN